MYGNCRPDPAEGIMNKHYETELPEGYAAVRVIDAKNKKFSFFMNAAAVFILILVLAATYLAVKPEHLLEDILSISSITRYWIFLAALVLYIVLHELVHGAVYKILTKRKLTFGLTFSVAYCGVPDIYTYRKTSLAALPAPFVVFNFVFGLPLFFLKDNADIFMCAVMLGLHVGGCIGDLYDTALLLFKYKSPLTLIKDDGPKQTIYVKKQS